MLVIASIDKHDQWMELQQMRYVVAVAEELSFTRAAVRCFVVQSALSHQVKALENELGVTLFARTSRRVALTAAGEAFLPAARASLAAAGRAVADATAATGTLRGELRLGVIPTVTAVDVPALLGAFRARHPGVRVSLRVAGSDELVAAIDHGELDVGLLGLAERRRPRDVAWRQLGSHRLVLVLPPGHPLAVRPVPDYGVHLGDLADETFADFPAGTPGRAQGDQAFAAADLVRDVAFEATSIDLILGLLRQGLAVALLPPGVVVDDPVLVTFPVVDGPVRREYVAWSDFNPSPTVLALLDCVDDHVDDHVDDRVALAQSVGAAKPAAPTPQVRSSGAPGG